MRVYTGSVWIAVVDLAGNVTVTSLTASSVDINGGTIDGVTIGGASAGAGTFTTLQANTSLNVDGTVTADGLVVDGNGTFSATRCIPYAEVYIWKFVVRASPRKD